MNVSLPEAMRAWVETRIESGFYTNASDYMRDLIRHDQAQQTQDWDAIDLEAMDDIRAGIADMKAGRGTLADEVFDRLEAKYTAMIDAQ